MESSEAPLCVCRLIIVTGWGPQFLSMWAFHLLCVGWLGLFHWEAIASSKLSISKKRERETFKTVSSKGNKNRIYVNVNAGFKSIFCEALPLPARKGRITSISHRYSSVNLWPLLLRKERWFTYLHVQYLFHMGINVPIFSSNNWGPEAFSNVF